MKTKKILNSKRLEQEHDIGKIGALNFRDRRKQHFVFVLIEGVKTIRYTENI